MEIDELARAIDKFTDKHIPTFKNIAFYKIEPGAIFGNGNKETGFTERYLPTFKNIALYNIELPNLPKFNGNGHHPKRRVGDIIKKEPLSYEDIYLDEFLDDYCEFLNTKKAISSAQNAAEELLDKRLDWESGYHEFEDSIEKIMDDLNKTDEKLNEKIIKFRAEENIRDSALMKDYIQISKGLKNLHSAIPKIAEKRKDIEGVVSNHVENITPPKNARSRFKSPLKYLAIFTIAAITGSVGVFAYENRNYIDHKIASLAKDIAANYSLDPTSPNNSLDPTSPNNSLDPASHNYDRIITVKSSEYPKELDGKKVVSGEYAFFVDKEKQTTSVWKNTWEFVEDMKISTGMNPGNKRKGGDHKTPEGYARISQIQNTSRWEFEGRGANPAPGDYGPWGLRLKYDGRKWRSILFHGTNEPYNLGKRVSHGCIRFHNEDISKIKENYGGIGSLVYISNDNILGNKDSVHPIKKLSVRNIGSSNPTIASPNYKNPKNIETKNPLRIVEDTPAPISPGYSSAPNPLQKVQADTKQQEVKNVF